MKTKEVKPNAVCGPFQGVGAVWSDDRTEVYAGNCDKITSGKLVSQAHPRPMKFEFQASCCDYLYFVSWSNDSGQNGLLVELQGDTKIYSGHSDWEVFATGINKNVGAGPGNSVSIAEVNKQLKQACKIGWVKPFVGQRNDGTTVAKKKPFGKIAGINTAARFMWNNSGKDGRANYPAPPYVPFVGFDHDEFLIFRIPVKTLFIKRCGRCECEECDCGCAGGCFGCNPNASEQNKELEQRAASKSNIDPSTNNSPGCPVSPTAVSKKCENQAISSRTSIEPCFYFHWGDRSNDQIEEHDTEVFYITVCNNFSDILFKGLRITKVTLNPALPISRAHIVPDRFVTIDCLEPCSCQSREFAIITRDSNIAGNYTLNVEYCYDEIVVSSRGGRKSASFPLVITED